MGLPHGVLRGVERGVLLPGVGGYRAQGVNFDGTNDVVTKQSDLTGAVDGPGFTISLNFRWNTTDLKDDLFIAPNGETFNLQIRSGNILRFKALGTTASSFNIDGTTLINDGNWHHVIWTTDGNNGNTYGYLDDVQEIIDEALTAGNYDLTFAAWNIGGRNTSPTLDGDLADVWYDDTFIDITQVANRRKFITAGGCPVNLGPNGENPTGSSPLIFLSGLTADWHTNKGSGGGFTEIGALTDAAANPCE